MWVWVGGWSWVRVGEFGKMRIRAYMCVHTCSHVRTRVHTCARVCTCVHMCAHVCTYVRVCVHGVGSCASADVRGLVGGWVREGVGGCPTQLLLLVVQRSPYVFRLP